MDGLVKISDIPPNINSDITRLGSKSLHSIPGDIIRLLGEQGSLTDVLPRWEALAMSRGICLTGEDPSKAYIAILCTDGFRDIVKSTIPLYNKFSSILMRPKLVSSILEKIGLYGIRGVYYVAMGVAAVVVCNSDQILAL